jgi:hypothetical protein
MEASFAFLTGDTICVDRLRNRVLSNDTVTKFTEHVFSPLQGYHQVVTSVACSVSLAYMLSVIDNKTDKLHDP